MDGETIVFVEVKARAAGFDERTPVGRHQRGRIARAARAFARRYGVADRPIRFDLVTVTGDPKQPKEMTWERNFHQVRGSA